MDAVEATKLAYGVVKNGDQLPAFPALVVTVDRQMARLPWWAVLGGGIVLGWWGANKLGERRGGKGSGGGS
jgi:hypothetical protein